MTDQEDIARRAEVIEQVDHWIAKAREALDLRGWARENGLDLDAVLASARTAYGPAELAQIEREAEAQFNALEQGLRETAQAASPGRATSSVPGSMRTRARL